MQCDCYIEDRQLVDYTPLMKPLYKTVALCFGTKERDRCSCGGDRTKCDFYPEVREKAKKEQKNNRTENSDDCLIVTYDYCHSDVPTLCIAREEKDKVMVLNTIQGDQAFGMYYYLTGYAELKEKEIETNADKIRSMSDEELAELLAEAKYNNKEIDMGEVCHKGMCLDGETCAGCMLKWLKKPMIKEQ